MPESFYEPDGDRYVSSELTRGPWDPRSQHAGPPAALLGREIERLEDGGDFHVARITFEILRAVPIAPLRVEARVTRPGRRVQMVEGALSDEEGEVMRASAWRLRRAAVELPEQPRTEPPPGPETAEARDFVPTGQKLGYHTAMEYRFLEGAFLEPGPAKVWMRMRQPLVAGGDALAAAAGPDSGRFRQRRQRIPRLAPLSVHQRRPQRPPGADAGGRVDLP